MSILAHPVLNTGVLKTVLATVPVNFDFATAAVVSFVLMLLGMAAGFLLMLRFAKRNQQEEAV